MARAITCIRGCVVGHGLTAGWRQTPPSGARNGRCKTYIIVDGKRYREIGRRSK
jgi:hypothetical protein